MKFYMLIVKPEEELQPFGDEFTDKAEAADYIFNEAEREPQYAHLLFDENKVVIGSWQAGHRPQTHLSLIHI